VTVMTNKVQCVFLIMAFFSCHSPRQDCLNGNNGRGNSYSSAQDACETFAALPSLRKTAPTPTEEILTLLACLNMIEEEKQCESKSNIPTIPPDL